MLEAPVQAIPADALEGKPEPGMALCLSGGGYRAMVFHVGSLWRLYESGLLGQIKRISSVSGGSITAGLLGLMWRQLSFQPGNLKKQQSRHLQRVITPGSSTPLIPV
jgi:NTE family protein